MVESKTSNVTSAGNAHVNRETYITYCVLSLVFLAVWLIPLFTGRLLGSAIFINLLLEFLLSWFIYNKAPGKTTLTLILIWFGVILLSANSVIGYNLSKTENIWTGFRYDTTTGWYPQKNLDNTIFKGKDNDYRVSTDEYGHRNNLPYPQDKVLPGIIQGDSNVFGFGLQTEDMISSRLNKILPFKFYNFGVSGFDVNNFHFQYKRFKSSYKIKNRLIIFNIGNDYSLSASKRAYYIKRPYLEIKNGAPLEVPAYSNSVKEQVYGHRLIDKYSNYNHKISNPPTSSWGDRYPDIFSKIPLIKLLLIHRIEHIRSKLYTPPANHLSIFYPDWLLVKEEKWPAPFNDYRHDFKEILRLLKSESENLVICLFPARFQVIDSEFELSSKNLIKQGYKPEDIDRFSFNKYMIQMGKELGIPIIDATPALFTETEKVKLFQKDDPHLSPEGVKILVERIARNKKFFKE